MLANARERKSRLPLVDEEKARRVHAAAGAWRARHPELFALELSVEAAGVCGRRVERVPLG